MITLEHLLNPNWPAHSRVRAYVTTRLGGHSQEAFASFNLAKHVGDNEQHVNANRLALRELLSLEREPMWLSQTHSTLVVTHDEYESGIEADASIAREPGHVCVVMTADCLPILITNQQGDEVAAIHAGWRGLCDGIIEATCKAFHTPLPECLAWIGPGIGPAGFEVDSDVYDAFIAADKASVIAFTPLGERRYRGDLVQLAKQRLAKCGLTAVYGGEHCTFSDNESFYSYRRDKETGRMATLIWFE